MDLTEGAEMGTRGIHRRWAVPMALGLLASIALVPGVARASGGGGCGGPVTDAAGTTVEMSDFCFTPTIVRMAPGEQVTFVNLDPTPHTVLGANGIWGSYDELKRGRQATYDFVEPGVYPYVCTWHVGMVGAVVVGDGDGGAIEATTAVGPVTRDVSPAAELYAVAASSTQAPAHRSGWWALALSALGLLMATVGVLVIGRLRRRALA